MSSSGACGYFLCDLCWASWEWALIAVFCVVACYLRTKYNWKWYRIFKPIPIGLILSFLILAFTGLGVDDPEDFHDPTFFLLCWNGLLFGAIGDVLLTHRTHFKAGIVTFGVGHIFYLAAFARYPFILPIWLTVCFCVLAAAFVVFMLLVAPGYLIEMDTRVRLGLITIVSLYGVILVMTVMFAANVSMWVWEDQQISTGIGLGATLFCLSDILLVVFVLGKIGEISTLLSPLPLFLYYLSQALLGHGVACFCFSGSWADE